LDIFAQIACFLIDIILKACPVYKLTEKDTRFCCFLFTRTEPISSYQAHNTRPSIVLLLIIIKQNIASSNFES